MTNQPSTSSTQSLPAIPLPTSLLSTLSPPTSLPPTTHALLTQHLLSSPTTIPDLQHTLTESLSRSGWTDRLRSLSLELLRNGTCDTFPQLLEEVMRRARHVPTAPGGRNTNTVNGTSTSGGGAGNTKSGAGSATASTNGGITLRPGWLGEDGLPDVRIPSETVEAGVDFLKERIKEVVEVVDSEDEG